MGFLFGGDTGIKSAEELARRRQVVDALLASNMGGGAPRTIGEGIYSFADSLASNWQDKQLAGQEAAAGQQASGAFDSIIAGLGSSPTASSSGQSYLAPQAPLGSATTPLDYGMAAAPSERIGDQPLAFGANNPLASGITETAAALGIDPVDLATAISYETAGTFDPTKAGPTTQWGQHRGLIQFGEPQAAQYGVDWNDPVGSQLGADGAVAKYLRDTGVQPGMGLKDIYSAINAGGVGRYGASDAGNGGAPGTVADKVAGMGDHRAKAVAMLGGTPGLSVSTQGASADPVPLAAFGQPLTGMDQPQQPMPAPTGQPAQGGNNMAIVAQLAELAGNPYLPEGQRKVVETMLAEAMKPPVPVDPMDAINLEKGRLELDALRNPVAKPPTPTSTMQEYELAKSQGFDGSFMDYQIGRAKAGATNVTVGGEGTMGTIPQGFMVVDDPLVEGGKRMIAIPGGPEDQAATDLAQASSDMIAGETIMTAADRARQAFGDRAATGWAGELASKVMPGGANAEVYRQVEVLKSNAKVENLTAMRQASPTGGALGSVTEKEAQMLAEKSGALDPKSPNFLRDLDDYERTLLRIIHGDQMGEQIYQSTRQGGATTPDTGGLNDDDLKYLDEP